MRRNDLQCLRAFAILAVLLFHFFPNLAPNGYFGVDLFFVLSGFLMTLVFSSSTISFASVTQFYYRRVKRIVPLYVFSILITLLSISYFLAPSFRNVNDESAQNALLFITNFANKDESNRYFIALQKASDCFTHTWSIAVEMQFYLFVPPLFALLSVRDNITFKCAILVALAIISTASRAFADAFNNPFCRLWQFCIGMAAFVVGDSFSAAPTAGASEKMTSEVESQTERSTLLSPGENDPNNILQPIPSSISKSISKLAPLAVIAILFCPIELHPSWAQCAVTILAGVAMAFGPHGQSILMDNRFLVYIGDISYALYLVHWPIFCILKNNTFFIVNNYGSVAAMLATILVAAFLHETYEKFYLKMGHLPVFILIAVLYLFSAGLLVRDNENAPVATNETVVEEDQNWMARFWIDKNESLSSVNHMLALSSIGLVKGDCYPLPGDWNPCEIKNAEFGRKGNHSMLIMGNSYSLNVKDLVVQHFAHFASSIKLRVIPACHPLVVIRLQGFDCTAETGKKFLKFVSDAKPDILFLIARHIAPFDDPIEGEITKDATFNSALDSLLQIESFVRERIYLLDSFFYQKLYLSMALKDGKINRGEEINPDDFTITGAEYERGHRRIAELSKRCKKCVLYSYVPYLTDKKSGKAILIEPNSKLRLVDNEGHLTPIGRACVDPVYRKLADQFEADIKNNVL